ncbi:MAG: hypothetical protein PHF05_06410 [Candidatus Izemoplasmatales bacterium]|nr:hypothetical protein [Candidatus Izemoplasmatales bacterium]
MKQETTFEDYLMEYFTANYPEILDDDIPDAFEEFKKKVIEIISKEFDKWNGSGEYYDNVSKALNSISNKITEISI